MALLRGRLFAGALFAGALFGAAVAVVQPFARDQVFALALRQDFPVVNESQAENAFLRDRAAFALTTIRPDYCPPLSPIAGRSGPPKPSAPSAGAMTQARTSPAYVFLAPAMTSVLERVGVLISVTGKAPASVLTSNPGHFIHHASADQAVLTAKG